MNGLIAFLVCAYRQKELLKKKKKNHKSEKTEPEACCGNAALGKEAADLNYITGNPA